MALHANEKYSLRNFHGYVIERIEGLGVPNTRRQLSRGAFQDGDTDLGFRLDAREIAITWVLADDSLWELDDIRQEIYSIFRPRFDDPVSLRFILASLRMRQANVNLIGVMDASDIEDVYGAQRLTAVFKASDPRLYDPRPQSVSFNLITYTDGWEIPWEIPWPIAQSAIDATETIFYASGDRLAAPEFPVIRLFGPIASPVIQNLTTGENLDFSGNGGLNVGLGEFVEINLAYGAKTAVNQDGDSVEQYLTDTSDLALWHLSYNSEVLSDGTRSDGNNVIRVVGNGASTVTRVEIYYYNRYVAA
jgi:hypothetical protein